MLRYAIIPFVAVAACPLPTFAVEPDIPVWCCPDACKAVDGTSGIVLSNEGQGSTAYLRGDEKIPLSKKLFRGDAPDGVTRVCIGFDAFGDPEIKCLFSPQPVT